MFNELDLKIKCKKFVYLANDTEESELASHQIESLLNSGWEQLKIVKKGRAVYEYLVNVENIET